MNYDIKLTHDELTTLKRAREILAETYCAWWSDHPDGVRHCAGGAVDAAGGNAYRSLSYLAQTARAIRPELHGKTGKRLENGNWCDNFDMNPVVFINNQLGKAAILQVFDAAILEAEIRLASAPIPEPEPDEQDDKAALELV